MKSLFDKKNLDEILDRINSLKKDSKSNWGTMDVSQMLAHCQEPIKIALGITTQIKEPYVKKMIMGLFKHKLYDDSTWKKNLPTTDQFKIKSNKNFDEEKEKLIKIISEFYSKKDQPEFPNHPIFGKFTIEQWGEMQYKHLDYHLNQFGQ